MGRKLNIVRLENAIWCFGLSLEDDERENYQTILNDLQAILLKLGEIK